MINDNGIAEELNFFVSQFYPTFKIDNLHNLNNRLPFRKHLNNKKIAKKFIKQLTQVNSIQECYMKCSTSNCDYFNVCKDESNGKTNCELLGNRLNERELNESLEDNNKCNVYEIKNLNLFDKYEEHRFLSKPLDNLKLNLNDCTTACLNRKDKECKSIVFCNDNLCELTTEHMENRLNKIEQNRNCTIYSINYLEDYHQISFKPIPKDKRKIFATIKGCALNCVESNNYISFNFCPQTMENTDIGQCSCTSKNDTISDDDNLSWNCITMQKNLKSFFYSNEIINKKSTKSNGYTFLKIAEISMIVFIIGNLIGIFVHHAIRQIKKTPSKNLKLPKINKIRFRKKSDQVELVE